MQHVQRQQRLHCEKGRERLKEINLTLPDGLQIQSLKVTGNAGVTTFLEST